MSHFGVLVFTDKKPEQDELEAIMMPWHEYECTGYEEYLEDVDITDEVMESWNKHSMRYCCQMGPIIGGMSFTS